MHAIKPQHSRPKNSTKLSKLTSKKINRLKKTKATHKSPLHTTLKRSISTSKDASLQSNCSLKTTSVSSRASSALSQHKDTPYNNATTKFEFTPESMSKIEVVLKKFPANYKQSAVMPVLFIAQEQNDNWLPLVAMDKVAELLDMPKMRVYEVATFYTMYNRDKVGKFHIQVCGTTTCLTMGARDIKKAAKKFAGVGHDGQISKDGLFCIVEVECLGACTNAPMIQVNNHEFYENLTTDSIVSVMKALVDGTAKVGPQNGQKYAEGPMGATTLVDYQEAFPTFNMSRIDAKLAEMKAAAGAPASVTPPPPAAAAATAAAATAAAATAAAATPKPTPVPEAKKATEAPKVVEAPKEAPKVVEAPKQAPKAAEAPQEAPKVVEAPKQAPKAAEAPKEAPKVVEAPKEASKTKKDSSPKKTSPPKTEKA